MSDIYITHLRLRAASDAALVAHYTEGAASEYKTAQVRKELIQALSRCEIGDSASAEDLLRDTIENALTDSMDHDWTVEMGARAVIQALFNFGEEA